MNDRTFNRLAPGIGVACLYLTLALATDASADVMTSATNQPYKYTNTNWIFDQVITGSVHLAGQQNPVFFGPINVVDRGMFFLGGPNGEPPTMNQKIDLTFPIKMETKEPGFAIFIYILTIGLHQILPQYNEVFAYASPDWKVVGPVYQFDNPAVDFGSGTLLANTEFLFKGFDPGTAVPDLRLASDQNIRITDVFGNLFPEYEFTSPVIQAGLIQIIPAPPVLGFVAIGFAAVSRRRRRSS